MAECMRANGVPSFPDPSSNGAGGIAFQSEPNGTVKVNGVTVTESTLNAAMHKCRSEMPQGPSLTASQIATIRRGALRMAECMRAHGVPNFPDPQITTGPGGHGVAIRIGINAGGNEGGSSAPKQRFSGSPAFQHARQICMPMMRALKTKS
jgi:hypothetical protein